MTFLIFDLDGTLADSMEANFKIINGLASKYGFHPIPIKDVREKEMKVNFRKAKVPLLKLPLIIEEAMTEVSKEKIHPFESIPRTLRKLKEKYNLGIITANLKGNADRFLEKNGLDIFDFVHSSALFSKQVALRKVIKDFNILEAYYIGDETRDIEAARKVKIKSVAVTWGYNSKNLLLAHKPDFIAERPQDLLKIF
jgi:phosphoglycolate phosphatase